MLTRGWLVAVTALLLLGCGSSGEDPRLVVDTVPDTELSDDELLDGAFEPGSTSADSADGDDATTSEEDATDDSDVGASSSTSTPEGSTGAGESGDGTGGSGSDDDTTGSSGGDGDTGTTGDDTTGGTTTGTATTGSSTGGATSTGATGSTDSSSTGGTATDGTTTGDDRGPEPGDPNDLEPGTALVTIGDLRIPVVLDYCDVQDDGLAAGGPSIASDGLPYLVTVTTTDFDIDSDGVLDQTLQVSVESDPVDASAVDTLPDFYAVGVSSGQLGTDFDLEFTLGDRTVAGRGPIADLNQIVLQPGETLPMSVVLRCA